MTIPWRRYRAGCSHAIPHTNILHNAPLRSGVSQAWSGAAEQQKEHLHSTLSYRIVFKHFGAVAVGLAAEQHHFVAGDTRLCIEQGKWLNMRAAAADVSAEKHDGRT